MHFHISLHSGKLMKQQHGEHLDRILKVISYSGIVMQLVWLKLRAQATYKPLGTFHLLSEGGMGRKWGGLRKILAKREGV